MEPLKMDFLLNMGIFHCYVSLPEGSMFYQQNPLEIQTQLVKGTCPVDHETVVFQLTEWCEESALCLQKYLNERSEKELGGNVFGWF